MSPHKTSPIALLLPVLAALAALAGCSPDDEQQTQKPPAPPPAAETDARDQIIYFILTDRFNDGDPTNNDQGAGEFDPADQRKYSGGDLRGITEKLDYIRDLGATAVWITPPVANQWWDGSFDFSGYHGYWAEDFTKVDAHYGSLDDYKTLADGLHDRGMLLIQDIVVNHTGNFFRCDAAKYDPQSPAACYEPNLKSKPLSAPSRTPFHMNDATNPDHVSAAIYHFTPPISNYDDPAQVFEFALADLDDLNTDNPVVVDALKDAYNGWIRDVGVDGFRIDTVAYTKPSLYADFIRSTDEAHPGVATFAERQGKKSFFTFGEAWYMPRTTDPYNDEAEDKMEAYVQKDGEPLIDSVINFPMHAAMGWVFGEGKPTRWLAHRLLAAEAKHSNPSLLVNFIDNHDRDRFAKFGSTAATKQALLFLLSIPGVPVIYYGTEQGFTEQRGSMFASGVSSGGVDHFDTSSEMYQFVKKTIKARTENAVLRRGSMKPIADSATGAGVLAYEVSHEGQRAFALFNTAETRVLLDEMETGLVAGSKLKLVVGLSASDGDRITGEGGRLTSALEPRAGMLFLATDEVSPVPPKDVTVTLDLEDGAVLGGDTVVNGTVKGASDLLLVIDGDLTSAVAVKAGADGSYSATLPVRDLSPDKAVTHTLSVYIEALNLVAERRSFTVDMPYVPLASVADPEGDDKGPSGKYAYPTDPSYAGGYGDMLGVSAEAAGNNLRLSMKMKGISTIWNPPNGFDHVSFTVYVDLPGKSGVTVMPQQNAVTPAGTAWDRMQITGGWFSGLYAADGATTSDLGASVSPSASVSVDEATSTVHLVFSPGALGKPESLSGAKIYVTTWDWDGGYRALKEQAGQWTFSGADGASAPLILDDTAVVELP